MIILKINGINLDCLSAFYFQLVDFDEFPLNKIHEKKEVLIAKVPNNFLWMYTIKKFHVD